MKCCSNRELLEYLYDRYSTYVMEYDEKSDLIIKNFLLEARLRCVMNHGAKYLEDIDEKDKES
jgi:hypothetical protein